MKILHLISSLDVVTSEEEAKGLDEVETKMSMVLGAGGGGGVGIEEWREMHRGRWQCKMIREGGEDKRVLII